MLNIQILYLQKLFNFFFKVIFLKVEQKQIWEFFLTYLITVKIMDIKNEIEVDFFQFLKKF